MDNNRNIYLIIIAITITIINKNNQIIIIK